MRKRIVTSLSVALVLGLSAPAATQSPPSYPDDVDVAFEPVGDSAWRVIEPDLDCDLEAFGAAEQTAVAPDGRVWLLGSGEGVRELGKCPVAARYDPLHIRDQALASDGTLWLLDGDRLASWDGSDWVVHVEGQFNVEMCTDGARQITAEEFDEHGGECTFDPDAPHYLFLDLAPDGAIWLSGLGSLGRYTNGEWHAYTEEWMGRPNTLGHGRLGFGPDGAVWVYGHEERYVFYP